MYTQTPTPKASALNDVFFLFSNTAKESGKGLLVRLAALAADVFSVVTVVPLITRLVAYIADVREQAAATASKMEDIAEAVLIDPKDVKESVNKIFETNRQKRREQFESRSPDYFDIPTREELEAQVKAKREQELKDKFAQYNYNYIPVLEDIEVQ